MVLKHTRGSLVKEAARALLKWFWKPRDPDRVWAWIKKYPEATVYDLIQSLFQDPHTGYESGALKVKKSSLPQPKSAAHFDIKTRTLYFQLETFVGIFGKTFSSPKYETQYISAIQDAIKPTPGGCKVVVDLTENSGGDDKVMRRALKGIGKFQAGEVLVSRMTSSAGEMIAADLIYDYGFKKRGPRTGGALTVCKNIVLSNGDWLGITQKWYTTPQGHTIKRRFL